MRILLIEDHKPMVRALRQGLEEEGFALDTALDGEEGNYKARTANYDVIILDLMLPKIDGLSLLQQWRRDGLSAHVLVLTARGSMEAPALSPAAPRPYSAACACASSSGSAAPALRSRR